MRWCPVVSSAARLALGALALGACCAALQAQTPAADQQRLQRFDGLWNGPDVMLFNLEPLARSEDPETPTPPLKGEYLERFTVRAAQLQAITQGAPPPAAEAGSARGPFAAGGPGGAAGPRLGSAMPQMMIGGMGAPLEFVVAKGRLYIINCGSGALRRIYTDGRGHPAADELVPNRFGHSIGHWEGRTLRVDTIGFVPGPIDIQTTHSEALHITERFTLIHRDTIRDEMTLEDAKALAQPWTSIRTYTRSGWHEVVDPDDADAPTTDRHF